MTAYVKFKSGRELRGWKACLFVAPFAIVFSPFLLIMAVLALPIIVAAKIARRFI
jgi:hypothetical protein